MIFFQSSLRALNDGLLFSSHTLFFYNPSAFFDDIHSPERRPRNVLVFYLPYSHLVSSCFFPPPSPFSLKTFLLHCLFEPMCVWIVSYPVIIGSPLIYDRATFFSFLFGDTEPSEPVLVSCEEVTTIPYPDRSPLRI